MNGAEMFFITILLALMVMAHYLLRATDNKNDEDDNDHDFWNDNKTWGV